MKETPRSGGGTHKVADGRENFPLKGKGGGVWGPWSRTRKGSACRGIHPMAKRSLK